MTEYTDQVIVTGAGCWDGKVRYHDIFESDVATEQGRFIVRVHEGDAHPGGAQTWYGGKVLNAECPAHTVEEAERTAKVFWMDHLGWDFSRCNYPQGLTRSTVTA